MPENENIPDCCENRSENFSTLISDVYEMIRRQRSRDRMETAL